MVCLIRSYASKFFKGCLPQTLLGPLLNTLSHMSESTCLLVPDKIKYNLIKVENYEKKINLSSLGGRHVL